MKTIFITGASSGLGKATAKLFAAKGWNVIATMRNPEKETELQHIPNISLLPLDVTDTAQINDTAAKAIALSGGIDVVFNNAGYGLIGPLETVTDGQLSRQFETNVLGVIKVTRAFIPHFREKKSGLFLTTTSIAGVMGIPLSAIYCGTKWAVEGWTQGLSFELNQLGIGIKTIAAGGIKTDFVSRSLDTTAHPEYDKMSERLYAGFDPETFTPAETIAERVYEAATDGKEQVRYMAGADAEAIGASVTEMGLEAFRQATAQQYFG